MTHSQSALVVSLCWIAMMALVAISAAGCAAPAPLPQPTPQVVRVEVPGPQPTPQVITKTVTKNIEVTPGVCVDAVNGLADALEAENDMLIRYYKGKQPTAAQWEAFLALDPDAIYDAMQECLAATDAGS